MRKEPEQPCAGAERATGSLASPASPRNTVRHRADLLAAACRFCVANRAGGALGKTLSVKLLPSQTSDSLFLPILQPRPRDHGDGLKATSAPVRCLHAKQKSCCQGSVLPGTLPALPPPLGCLNSYSTFFSQADTALAGSHKG